MAGRKIRDEVDARECLEAAAHSGVSRRQWAHDHGVDARSLNAWRMNLARRGQRRQPGLRLVELVPAGVASKASRPLVVRCGPWSVEVTPEVDEELLATVLGVIATC
jgi:transposase-like protein